MPKAGFYDPVAKALWQPRPRRPTRPQPTPSVIPILFYRSMLLAADVAPIDALSEALRQRVCALCRSSSPA